ncbi:MAG: T9SS C-terminal target domain-containing protein [Bacteroidetes bacterium]|nr:MAG: T9SS C-terminal target domain-containing protein [Bacteroidota bacterium]
MITRKNLLYYFIFVLLILPAKNIFAQDLKSDSLALVALYKSTNGSNWKNTWNLTKPLSTWLGVKVSNQRVTELDVFKNNLTGTLPAEIGNLTAIQRFYVDQNQITGTIPKEIGNLQNAVRIYLSENLFEGTIPVELAKLSKLERLRLFSNKLTGTIPPELGNLPTISEISLDDNKLTGSIPKELANIKNLISIYVERNQLTGTIPDEIYTLKNLEVLSVYFNQISGEISPKIGNLSKLQVLFVDGNQMTGKLPAEIGNLPDLIKIFADNNKFEGTIPTSFGNLKNLKKLYLNNNKFSGTVPPSLTTLRGLNILSLNDNQFTDLPNFTALDSLEIFNIQNNQFTFEDIEDNIKINAMNYNQQDSITLFANNTASADSVRLSVFVGGANNYYRWFRNGVEIQNLNRNIINVSSKDAKNGVYRCIIGNAVASLLNISSKTTLLYNSVTAVEKDSFLDKELAIFPNPTQDFLQIKLADEFLADESKALIYDLTGRLVHEKTLSISDKTLSVSDLAKGTYVLKVISSKNDWARVFVKE